MLFRINMYPAGRERRASAERRVRQFATLAAVAGVNAAVVVLFLAGLGLSKQALSVSQTRLAAAQEGIAQILDDQGGAMTNEELDLVRVRAAQVKWSAVMSSVSRVTPREVWLSRMRLTEGVRPGGRDRTPGLRITGTVRAGSEQAGLSLLMKYLAALRDDEYFARHFQDPKLVGSTWLTAEGVNLLEFDAFCPLAVGITDLSAGGPAESLSAAEMQVGPESAEASEAGTGGQREGAH